MTEYNSHVHLFILYYWLGGTSGGYESQSDPIQIWILWPRDSVSLTTICELALVKLPVVKVKESHSEHISCVRRRERKRERAINQRLI
jgi:hypothetical protein